MATQLTNRERLAFKLDHLSENEIDEVFEYVSIMESMRLHGNSQNLLNDELFTSLVSAYENQRAQQVMEWESARQRAGVR